MGTVFNAPPPSSVSSAAADCHAPGAATAAVVTYAADESGRGHVVSGLAWSYSAAPTGGNLKIEDGSGNTVFTMDITAAGPGSVTFTPPKRGLPNTALIATLASGAGAVVGKLSVIGHWLE